ncbi:glycosyltransferase family 2 protein [Candidatus Gottesmanbacteria bacterium]|nr:glycosyltransferase family 2 protein [Candidatus Gottesmanbacteria bacterium]
MEKYFTPKLEDMDKPLLSVIVCTYYREKLLRKCLLSLVSSIGRKKAVEIIVVDNNSPDNTKNVVEEFQKRNPNIKYFLEPKVGLSGTRNRGASVAEGIYLCYIDDDATVPPTYIKNLMRIVSRYKPDIVSGPVYPVFEGNKPFWLRSMYYTKKDENRSGFSDSCKVSGANFTIRKKILCQLGLFDPALGMKGNKIRIGEERKVLDSYRATIPKKDQKVYFSLPCYVHHFVSRKKMRLLNLLRRSFNGGKCWALIERSLKTQKDGYPILTLLLFFLFIPFFLPYSFIREFITRALKGSIGFDWVKLLMRDFEIIGRNVGRGLIFLEKLKK